MKEKKRLNQNTFLLLVTILLFFVMYAIGCVLFNAQGFAKTQNFLNLFISNAGLIVIGIGMTIVMITGGIDISWRPGLSSVWYRDSWLPTWISSHSLLPWRVCSLPAA